MKATTKKLLISTFVLVIAIALATSTTYAWFAMNTTPEIREFTVDITAGDNLLIAVTARGVEAPDQALFKSYIATSEITGVGGVGQFFSLTGAVLGDATSLTTATSTDGQTFLKEDGVLLVGEGAYYAFDVHFIGSAAFEIQLNNGTQVTSNQGTATNDFPAYVWAAVASQEFGNVTLGAAETEIIAHAKNAVRIAFVEDFDFASPSEDFNIYEPNANAGDSYGNYGGTSANNLAIAYYNYMLEANISEDAGNQTTFTDLLDDTLLTLVLDGDVYTGTFTVVIWLEGWDADAFDSVKNQTIATILNFIGV